MQVQGGLGPGLWLWGSGCGMIGWYRHRILHCAQVPGVAQVLLPHEVLALMMELGDGRLILRVKGWIQLPRPIFRGARRFWGVGLWLPSLSGRCGPQHVGQQLLSGGADLDPSRVGNPTVEGHENNFAALPHDLTTTATLHQLLAVFSWSMQCLFKGLFPSNRP